MTNTFKDVSKLATKLSYLNVYMTLPLLHNLRRRLGVVIQWAFDFREFRKNVSGIHILPTMLLLSMSSFIELLNFRRLSYHVWAKKMSIVYSCNGCWESCKQTRTIFKQLLGEFAFATSIMCCIFDSDVLLSLLFFH